MIAFNDNWKDSQKAEITSVGLAPTDDRESAIMTSLPARGLTAIVRGKDDTTGIALVEIYNLGMSGADSVKRPNE